VITLVEDCDVTIWSYLDNRQISVLDETGEIEVAIRALPTHSSGARRRSSLWTN